MGKVVPFGSRREGKRKGKVKCTLVQVLRFRIGPLTHRRSRGIAILFLDHGTRRE